MNTEGLVGLTEELVKKNKKIGLSNKSIDTYSPSYIRIVLTNVFSLINLILIPLLAILFFFGLYKEILAFSTFLLTNTIISAFDQIRIKRSLDKLKSQFEIKTKVLRGKKVTEIPLKDIVVNDVLISEVGESIVADGKVLQEKYLQVDESSLTGESNYVKKNIGDEVRAGSYVVTGYCVYRAENIGKSNYLNKLGSEALKFKEKRSKLQKISNKIIFFLIVATILVGFLNFVLMDMENFSEEQRLLSITTIVSLIIPQTLIFLYTLTFTISIHKLYKTGVLVQKGGSIEDLSRIDTICFDKTGTITTNEMKIFEAKYFNLNEETFAKFYNSLSKNMSFANKTQDLINRYYSCASLESVSNFKEIPFNSKIKFSLLHGEINNKHINIVLGAWEVLHKSISKNIYYEVKISVDTAESEGFRVLLALFTDKIINNVDEVKDFEQLKIEGIDSVVLFKIEEMLNFGIVDIFKQLQSQNIEIKIISGDSKRSVLKILSKLKYKVDKVCDLSDESIDSTSFKMSEIGVFCRAKPEDKLKIIQSLQAEGKNVAMVGDGVNDVLGLKSADVSISLEYGSKIAREVSDIVLLKNDFNKLPKVFFEGENIINNLSISTKLFLTKCFYAIVTGVYFSVLGFAYPLLPNSTLIFSFLGSSAPSYFVIFTRQKTKVSNKFFTEVFKFAVLSSLPISIGIILSYHHFKHLSYSDIFINTFIVLFVLVASVIVSLILLINSNRMRKTVDILFWYTVMVLTGFIQTIYPVVEDTSTINSLYDLSFFQIFMNVVVFILIYFVVIKTLKLSKSISFFSKIPLSLVLTLCGLLIINMFPFHIYYNVTRIRFEYYIILFLVGIVLLFSCQIIFKILQKIKKL